MSVTKETTSCAPPSEPPTGSFLDAVARWIEGGGTGTPSRHLLDLGQLVAADSLERAPRAIVRFYANPLEFSIRTGVEMSPLSRLVFGVFAAIARQSCVTDAGPAFEGYPVAQFLYRDRRGRLHWDRYVCIGGRWRRLFLARVEAREKLLRETFVVCGLPVTLCFRATADASGLSLVLARRWQEPWSYLLDVSYRTSELERGLRTLGDFRVRLFGLRVLTEFRMQRSATSDA